MFYFIIYLIITSITAIVAWWLYFTSTRFYKLCIKIPGPTPLPVIGNVELMKDRKLFLRNLLNLFQRNFPMCRVFLGNFCIIGLLDADDIHKFLNSRDTLSKPVLYTPVKLLSGETILTAKKEDWKRYRRIFSPGFSTQIMKNCIGVFNEKCNILIKVLKCKDEMVKFDINNILCMATIDMIIESSSDIDVKILEKNMSEAPLVMEKSKDLLRRVGYALYQWPQIIFKRSSFYREELGILKSEMKYFEPIKEKYISILNEEKDIMNNGINEKNDNFRIFDSMLQFLHNKKEILSEEELKNQIRFLEKIGSETTAFTLSVCLMLLGLHKDVQDKAVEELHSIFGDDVDCPAEYEDLQRMRYMEQVIKETLRLFPVYFVTLPNVDEDIEIGGYCLPSGSIVAISKYVIHRNPKYFPDPLKFDPERFTPENIRARNPHCFIPFLTGPRNCIGQNYAMLQMKIVLCHLLRHFEFLPCGTREQMEEVDMPTSLYLKHGYNVRIKARN